MPSHQGGGGKRESRNPGPGSPPSFLQLLSTFLPPCLHYFWVESLLRFERGQLKPDDPSEVTQLSSITLGWPLWFPHIDALPIPSTSPAHTKFLLLDTMLDGLLQSPFPHGL